MTLKIMAFTGLLFLNLSGLHAQDQPNVGCIDKVILEKAADVKRGFMKQGMTVYRDAMIGMESQTPYPVAVKLVKGHYYEFLFLGNQDANTKLELYDGEDKKMSEKSLPKGAAPGYIIYSFTPENTDMYLLVLSQKLKHAESMCGSFTIMEKSDEVTEPAPAKANAANSKKPASTPSKNYGNQTPNSNRYLGNGKN